MGARSPFELRASVVDPPRLTTLAGVLPSPFEPPPMGPRIVLLGPHRWAGTSPFGLRATSPNELRAPSPFGLRGLVRLGYVAPAASSYFGWRPRTKPSPKGLPHR
jgi:hypothetical protein